MRPCILYKMGSNESEYTWVTGEEENAHRQQTRRRRKVATRKNWGMVDQ
jgi:hypothetical protein